MTTGTVTGNIKDPQGGVIPGAAVTLISSTRGTTLASVTADTDGVYTFPNVPPDSYLIRVTMDGFKTLERPGVAVSPGDRVAVPALVIEVGGLAETVTVAAEAPMIQSQTGERSFAVATESVQSLPISNRSFTSLTSLAPGVDISGNNPGRLGGGGSNNTLMDGVSTVDTGNNQPVLFLNLEAIAEVKVLTSGYQAEYGKASGIQITAVTKSGTNRFRGSLYDVRRDSDWNSNSWANIKNGNPKAVNKEDDWGYSIGGPVGKAGGRNKLFFFFSQEWKPRTTAGALNRFRFPTALERAGDFSQSRDNNGAIFNLIRNASTNLPCTAANTSGCYQDGGVLGRIPQSALYQIGLNILKQYPMPNLDLPGLAYNYEAPAPRVKTLNNQPTIRAAEPGSDAELDRARRECGRDGSDARVQGIRRDLAGTGAAVGTSTTPSRPPTTAASPTGCRSASTGRSACRTPPTRARAWSTRRTASSRTARIRRRRISCSAAGSSSGTRSKARSCGICRTSIGARTWPGRCSRRWPTTGRCRGFTVDSRATGTASATATRAAEAT